MYRDSSQFKFQISSIFCSFQRISKPKAFSSTSQHVTCLQWSIVSPSLNKRILSHYNWHFHSLLKTWEVSHLVLEYNSANHLTFLFSFSKCTRLQFSSYAVIPLKPNIPIKNTMYFTVQRFNVNSMCSKKCYMSGVMSDRDGNDLCLLNNWVHCNNQQHFVSLIPMLCILSAAVKHQAPYATCCQPPPLLVSQEHTCTCLVLNISY